jgi:hypothetical protein
MNYKDNLEFEGANNLEFIAKTMPNGNVMVYNKNTRLLVDSFSPSHWEDVLDGMTVYEGINFVSWFKDLSI